MFLLGETNGKLYVHGRLGTGNEKNHAFVTERWGSSPPNSPVTLGQITFLYFTFLLQNELP